MIRKHRDIQLIEKDKDHYLAVACDVSASIGPKAQDVVKVTAEIAGYYAAAVPIIELLAIGAKPISVVDTLGVEMYTIGESVIRGVKLAMLEGSIDPDCLTGSTEDNIPTVTTTVGVTVIAELEKHLLNDYRPTVGQHVYVVGVPKMGQRFLEEEIEGNQGEVITIAAVKAIRSCGWVAHMLPVGSKGIQSELLLLLEMYGLSMERTDGNGIDMTASAGPATCMLVTCEKDGILLLESQVQLPITYLGQLLE